MLSDISLHKSHCKNSTNSWFSVESPLLQTKESNFWLYPPVKNSNANIFCSFWSSPILFTFSIILSKSSIFSLKVSHSCLIVCSISGKIDWSYSDKFVSPILGTGLLRVIVIVLFFSSVIWVIDLAKLSIVGLEGSGAIFLSLFLNGDKLSGLVSSKNEKLDSHHGSCGSRKCGDAWR